MDNCCAIANKNDPIKRVENSIRFIL